MEDVFMLLLLAVSAMFVYSWCYRIGWYEVGPLFNFIPTTSQSDKLASFKSIRNHGNEFFYKFYAEYSVSSHKMLQGLKILFSVAMVCYVLTVEIVLWQIFTADSTQKADIITYYIWPLVLFSLMCLLTVIQPFFIIISLFDKFFNDKLDVLTLSIITAVTVGFLVGSLSLVSFGPFMHTNNILTKLSIGGVSMLAILSAIATVSTLYYTFLMFWKKSHPSLSEIQVISPNKSNLIFWTKESSLYEKLNDYKRNIDENVNILQRLEKEPGGSSSVLKEQLIEKIGWYQLEQAKLESLIKQPYYNRIGRRIFNTGFLIFCMHKLVTTFCQRVPYIIIHAVNYPDDHSYKYFDEDSRMNFGSDPLAVTLANILNIFILRHKYDEDLESLTKQISLILSTSLFVASLSTVVTTISYMSSLLPVKFQILAMFAMQQKSDQHILPSTKSRNLKKSMKTNPSLIKNLIVSELTGIYVAATILTIRSNLPFEISQKLNELLGERFSVPNAAIDVWFYQIYSIFCIVTFLAIKFAERTFMGFESKESFN